MMATAPGRIQDLAFRWRPEQQSSILAVLGFG
jgi:hypothetical protein